MLRTTLSFPMKSCFRVQKCGWSSSWSRLCFANTYWHDLPGSPTSSLNFLHVSSSFVSCHGASKCIIIPLWVPANIHDYPLIPLGTSVLPGVCDAGHIPQRAFQQQSIMPAWCCWLAQTVFISSFLLHFCRFCCGWVGHLVRSFSYLSVLIGFLVNISDFGKQHFI